jgi:3-oxoacyl-[acyl-carrier protein] reductase
MSEGKVAVKLDFRGKTVVVTGGARGIGAAISVLFAESGAKVMIDYLPVESDIEALKGVEREIRDTGGRFESFPADVTSPAGMEELCGRTLDRFGSLDILVNSAGFTIPAKVGDLSADLWQSGIEVNLSGAFYATHAACRHMIAQGTGRIIYIGSAGSITGGGGSAAYSAAKAGINGLVRALSKELAPQGITVNAVLPALIETDLLRDKEPDPEKRRKYIERIPVGRFGTPRDVAYVVLFLASEYAGFITGQNIIVDGGATYK